MGASFDSWSTMTWRLPKKKMSTLMVLWTNWCTNNPHARIQVTIGNTPRFIKLRFNVIYFSKNATYLYYITSDHVISCHVMSCQIKSYHISYHIISYHIISYHISYHIISYYIILIILHYITLHYINYLLFIHYLTNRLSRCYLFKPIYFLLSCVFL